MLPGAFDSNNVTARNYNDYFGESSNMIGNAVPELYINICYEQDINGTMTDMWYGCDMSKIVVDTMNFSKSCLSSNQFETGGCEASSFGVTIHDPDFAQCVLTNGVSFKNRPIIVTLITSIAGIRGRHYAEYVKRNSIYQNGIRLFTGFIDDIKVDIDNLTVELIAYDIFYLFDKTDGSRVWNLMFPGSAESKMNVPGAIQSVMDRVAINYRIPGSEPDSIKVTEMDSNNWTDLFYDTYTSSWQSYVEIRSDSQAPIRVNDGLLTVGRNLIVSKEAQKVTIDQQANTQTTKTHKININMKSLDIEQIEQTVVKNNTSGEETTTTKTILAQLKEALPIPDPPEEGEPLTDQETVITITETDAEGNETVNTYEGVRNYEYSIPPIIEDAQGGQHTTFIHCIIRVYQESAKEHLLIQTSMQDEDTYYEDAKETIAYSGNYISDKTSIRDIIKSYCQSNAVFAYADAYGRIVMKHLTPGSYNSNYINLTIDGNPDYLPSGAMAVLYDSVSLGSNEGLAIFKQAVLRNSEKDPAYGRYPDQPWETNEYGEYNGKLNILVVEGSLYLAELNKDEKMRYSTALYNRIHDVSANLNLPYPYSQYQSYGNNKLPRYEIAGVTFNPYYEPTDPFLAGYNVQWDEDEPGYYHYDVPCPAFFFSYLLNMDISMSNGFKFNTNNDLEYDVHWIKAAPSGFNIEDPESSGLSDGGSGSGGLSAFAVYNVPEHPRANTIYFLVTEDEE